MPDDADAAAVGCVLRAVESGTPAELQLTVRGTEGGTMRQIVRVVGPGEFEMLQAIDGEWQALRRCALLEIAEQPQVFRVDGCDVG